MNRTSRQTQAARDQEGVAFTPLNGAMLDAFAEVGQAYLKGVVAFNHEVLSFANQRLRTNADVGETLAKCESWADAARVQQDWTHDMTQACFAEGTRLMELAAQVTMDSWAPLLERANGAMGEARKT